MTTETTERGTRADSLRRSSISRRLVQSFGTFDFDLNFNFGRHELI